MYLHSIKATNFRVFGDDTTGPKLDWVLNPGMNILVGENDAGKTAVIDAIRSVLWSTSFEMTRISEQAFHIHGQARATSMTIELTLRGLSDSQEAALLEWLTYESDGTGALTLTLTARWVAATPKRRARVETMVRTGPGVRGLRLLFPCGRRSGRLTCDLCETPNTSCDRGGRRGCRRFSLRTRPLPVRPTTTLTRRLAMCCRKRWSG